MELAKPKNWVDHVAIWCAKYLIFVILGIAAIASMNTVPVLLVSAVLCAWVLAFALQYLFKHKRPFMNGQAPLIKMLFETPSFPSAHTAVSFSIATAFVVMSEVPLLGLFCLGMAVLMAWSRVRVHVHYAVDTYAGAALGVLSVYIVGWVLLAFGIID